MKPNKCTLCFSVIRDFFERKILNSVIGLIKGRAVSGSGRESVHSTLLKLGPRRHLLLPWGLGNFLPDLCISESQGHREPGEPLWAFWQKPGIL